MNKQSQESENFGCEQILNTFSSVFSDVRVMQNIIMPMDGFGYCPTAEFDVIVSCNAGVFVFEIKGYTGNSIEISKTEKEIHIWKIHKDNGVVEIQDPLAQTGRKIKYLRESIRGSMVRGFVYFTNEKISLPPNANADVIKTNDLAYLVRSLRHDAKRRNKLISTENVNKIIYLLAFAICKNELMFIKALPCITPSDAGVKLFALSATAIPTLLCFNAISI